MPPKASMIGQKFGLLTVVAEIPERLIDPQGKKRLLWECQCECGGTAKCHTSELRRGYRVSCGCRWRKGIPKKNGTRLSNRKAFACAVYHSARHSAGKRGLEWRLARGEFEAIVGRPCVLCGTRDTVGVDRFDPEGGYTLANTIPMCWECNRAKGQLSMGEFRQWIDRVTTHSGASR